MTQVSVLLRGGLHRKHRRRSEFEQKYISLTWELQVECACEKSSRHLDSGLLDSGFRAKEKILSGDLELIIKKRKPWRRSIYGQEFHQSDN